MGTGPVENIPFLSLYVFSCLAFLSVSRPHCHCSCWQNCCFLWCTLSSASSRFFICFAGSDLFLMITPMLNMQEKDISSSYLCVCLISFSFFCAAGCLQNTGFCRLCFPLSVPAPVILKSDPGFFDEYHTSKRDTIRSFNFSRWAAYQAYLKAHQ